jgi:glyoxylase-like metal-dependent hydrolase (beta-lactamase superfamily II)
VCEYEVYAICYGDDAGRRTTQNFIGGDPHDGPMPMSFFIWAIRGPDRTWILDTGFDVAMARKRGRRLLRPIEQGLLTLGIDASAVQDVIVSHMHYDHAGNHAAFPSARYHLQEREMRYCTGRCMCHEALRLPFEADDVTAMVRKVFAGRVAFYDGSHELAPGLSVHWVGGHSQGLQVVRVRTRRGWLVLASDASHYYANIEQRRPFPLVYNVGEMLEGFETLNRLGDSADHIIPGHDPLVLTRYPSVCEGIVRLDVEPHPAK